MLKTQICVTRPQCVKRRISTCRSKVWRKTSNLCTHCWNSEWHRSSGSYGILTLIISVSASVWKGFTNVSITEIPLRLFPFWLDSVAVCIYSKFAVCHLFIHKQCKCKRRRNVTPVTFFVRKYRYYVKHCRYRLAICKLFMKNRVSKWEGAKIVCIVAAETYGKSYIPECVIYFVDHHAGDWSIQDLVGRGIQKLLKILFC